MPYTVTFEGGPLNGQTLTSQTPIEWVEIGSEDKRVERGTLEISYSLKDGSSTSLELVSDAIIGTCPSCFNHDFLFTAKENGKLSKSLFGQLFCEDCWRAK